MEKQKLDSILAAHAEWLVSDGSRGERADLRGANLRGANLIGPPDKIVTALTQGVRQ